MKFLFQAAEEYRHCENVSEIDQEDSLLHPYDRDPRPDKAYSVVVNMASVCSYWYHTALSMAQLWSYIGTRNSLKVTKVLLERSREAPLYISCSAGVKTRDGERWFLELVIPHLHRWKAFDAFTGPAASFYGCDLEDHAASVLEHFAIHKSAKTSNNLHSVILDRAPRLRDLHIANSQYPLGLNAVNGLISLSVRAEVGGRAFTMEDFELLFSASPRLETLLICGTKTDEQSPALSFKSLKPIKLRLLTMLHLDPKITNILLLSIFPEHGQYPLIKVIKPKYPAHLVISQSDQSRDGSLLDLYVHNATWLTVSENEDYLCTRIQIGMESVGARVPLLEVDTDLEEADSVVASFIHPGGTSLIRRLEVPTTPNSTCKPLGSKLHLCPHLEHLVIGVSYNRRPQNFRVLNALSLPHLNGETEPLSAPVRSPRLKQLTLKPLHDLWSVVQLFTTKYGPSNGELITAGLLRGLEMLEIQYIRESRAEHSTGIRQALEALLANQGIQLRVIPVPNS